MFGIQRGGLEAKYRPFFMEHIWKRGRQYYQKGYVTEMVPEGNALIRATVSGTENYRVLLDLDSFPASTCTCPYGHYCKHMAAVLLAADERTELVEVLPGDQANRVGTKQLPLPRETGSPAEWHRYFRRQFGKVESLGMFSIDAIFTNNRTHLLSVAREWDSPVKDMYAIHVCLFLLQQLDQLYIDFETRYVYYDFTGKIKEKNRQLMGEMLQIAKDIDWTEALRESPQHQQELAAFLAQHAFPNRRTPVNWSFIYRYFWTRLSHDTTMEQAELARLQAELEKTRLAGVRRQHLVLAQAHFAIVGGDDPAARELLLNEVTETEPGYFMGYLYGFQVNTQWDRLQEWLVWLRLFVRNWEGAPLQEYLEYWRELVKHKDAEADWTQTVLYLLPKSYAFYADYLIEQARYQEWADLNMVCGLTPFDVDLDHLEKVESAARHFLLPMYHQAVDRFIQDKNRTSYKQAVKLLRRLEEHYRQLEESRRWQTYMDWINKHYAKYRAFQEELQKGLGT